jgi:hypothetical protein
LLTSYRKTLLWNKQVPIFDVIVPTDFKSTLCERVICRYM